MSCWKNLAKLIIERDGVYHSECATSDDVARAKKEVVTTRGSFTEAEADGEFARRLHLDPLEVIICVALHRLFTCLDFADSADGHVTMLSVLREAMASSKLVGSSWSCRGVG